MRSRAPGFFTPEVMMARWISSVTCLSAKGGSAVTDLRSTLENLPRLRSQPAFCGFMSLNASTSYLLGSSQYIISPST